MKFIFPLKAEPKTQSLGEIPREEKEGPGRMEQERKKSQNWGCLGLTAQCQPAFFWRMYKTSSYLADKDRKGKVIPQAASILPHWRSPNFTAHVHAHTARTQALARRSPKRRVPSGGQCPSCICHHSLSKSLGQPVKGMWEVSHSLCKVNVESCTELPAPQFEAKIRAEAEKGLKGTQRASEVLIFL